MTTGELGSVAFPDEIQGVSLLGFGGSAERTLSFCRGKYSQLLVHSEEHILRRLPSFGTAPKTEQWHILVIQTRKEECQSTFSLSLRSCHLRGGMLLLR